MIVVIVVIICQKKTKLSEFQSRLTVITAYRGRTAGKAGQTSVVNGIRIVNLRIVYSLVKKLKGIKKIVGGI